MTVPAQIAVAVRVAEGRVLLVHRTAQREHFPDTWSLPGGHMEPGESPLIAVVREVREELGVEIVEASPFALHVNAPDVVMHGFIATSWDGVPANLARDEHDDLAWFTSRDLRELTLAHPESLDGIIAAMDVAQQ